MRYTENIRKLVERSYLKNLHVPSGKEMDERILGNALSVMEESKKTKPVLARPNIGRVIIKSRITQLSAAIVIIFAVILFVSVLDKSVTPAYAVDQTIAAIKEVKTVHMTGEFYKQGEFECWMKFAGNPDRPTHMWLGSEDSNLSKICSPEGVFGLNRRTNAVHFARRDERGKAWVIKFGSFFKDAVRKAHKTDSVDIYNEIDPKTDKELIVVHIKTQQREQKFVVDPETKLPISFSTIREDAPMEMLIKTLAVKNLEWIRYNEQPPDGIFDMPADAKIVEDEVDCMVDPDSGLIAEGMTREQACLAIVEQTGKALIDVDVQTLRKLDLFFRLYTPQIWEQIKQMKSAGQWVDKFTVTGAPYQEDELWYVPCEITGTSGEKEAQTAMIKFYDFDGRSHCFIIGSKEKGVVD